MTVRVALLGAGAVAQFHADAFAAVEMAQLVAVVDPELRAAQSLAGRCGCAVAARSLADAVNLADIDAVIIAAPTPAHHNLAVQAIDAGLHVLIEKPMTSSLDEAERLIRAADEAGVRLVSGQVLRFMPMFETARDFIDTSGLGEVVQIIERRLTYREVAFPWWHGRPDFLIGHWASHSIDIINSLTGLSPQRVFCLGTSVMPQVEGIDDCTTVVSFDNGSRLTAHFSFCARRPVHDIVMIGTAATIEFECYRSVSVNGELVMQLDPDEMLARGFERQLADFLAGIRSGRHRSEARSVLPTMAAIDAAERSLREHAVVQVRGTGS